MLPPPDNSSTRMKNTRMFPVPEGKIRLTITDQGCRRDGGLKHRVPKGWTERYAPELNSVRNSVQVKITYPTACFRLPNSTPAMSSGKNIALSTSSACFTNSLSAPTHYRLICLSAALTFSQGVARGTPRGGGPPSFLAPTRTPPDEGDLVNPWV
ncbi:hypothetical protein CEXT_750211 [Caerostris extrusa]|uniref:Uncharacterized protein n=1 Tax=Caerostris extrusa TaxID=172846 RepID=A0AAV4NU39_CAEEX|nr:hypothetical protein CEXT_750211 [Caerostris extrusa]